MPRLKIFLPDVNIWLAIASRRHIYSQLCIDWLDSVTSSAVVFCRVTQMGLLRLLTNQTVMAEEVLTSKAAWRVYETMLSDERISFVPEPFGVEPLWKRLTDHDLSTPKLWADAYLAAFAQTAAMQLVTLDLAMLKVSGDALLLNSSH